MYTNRDSLSIGLVLHIGSLRDSRRTPYDLLNDFMAQPQIAKLLRGGRLMEYSAHLIPEGGYDKLPELFGDGVLVTGDAAGFCYANGLNLEGINLAVHSGILAAETAIEATGAKDYSATALSQYRRKLEASFVLRDLKLYRHSPRMMHIDRLYEAYPEVLCGFIERIHRIDGTPKQSLPKLFLSKAKERMGLLDLLVDAFTAWRAL
jgi:electron transfer flavoprotein-quinone oxidoreductase